MPETETPVERRSRPRRTALIVVMLVLLVVALVVSLATRMTPYVREQGVAALNARFQSDVELKSLRVSVFPRPAIVGQGLILRHHGRTDVTPLIQIASYSASAGLFGLMGSPLHLRTVDLEGLKISIPPKGQRGFGKSGSSTAESAPPKGSTPPKESAPPKRRRKGPPRLVIDQIVSKAAQLEMVPRNKAKQPRLFEIHDLVMHGFGEDKGATFEAVLTNPKPRGEIKTQGTFGPWRPDEPGLTPVGGKYAFNNANLNTIKGIAGILSSVGSYSGVLERIEVKGETDTPDFSVDIAAQPVPLKTRFQAIVDGTNGDTFLNLVEARVLETLIVARGAVVRSKDVKGRRITLDVKIENGRIEDVLKFGVKSAKPLMTGRMRLSTKFNLPAGDRDVVDKLELSGTFSLDEGRFTNVDIQQRINTLSRRGKGSLADEGPSVVSSLSSRFTLRDGTISFADLSFGVPGAIVQLTGTYDIRNEALDFRGHLLIEAGLAQTTSGFKALLARIAQPLFRRPGGGSKLPIRISGSREKPEFGLDVKRALTPGD